MNYIPLLAIGLAIWGLISLDWFKVGFAVVIFLVAFLYDLSKKKAIMKDDKVFSSYKTVTDLIQLIKQFLDGLNVNRTSPKAKIVQGLYFMGMVDAASQGFKLDNKQFLDLHKSIFHDLAFGDDITSNILIYHQKGNRNDKAYQAIMKGGDTFTKFMQGNTMAPLAAGPFIKEYIDDSEFPSSLTELKVV